MKKIVKIIGWAFLTVSILFIGYGAYVLISNPWAKELIANNESKLFYRPSTEMKSMENLEYSEHILKVEDSIEIYTYLFHPPMKPKANIFLVGGNSGNITTYQDLIKPLVDNGFRVYSPEWRGYGKSTGTPNYKGIMRDTEAAFEDFNKKIAGDGIKTVVYGMSLGGQLAIKITKDNQKDVDALILDGSLESAYSFLADNVNGSLLQPLLKEPENYNQDYVAVRDVADINNIPKLIIHSKIDRAVPFERGKNIFNAAKKPKEFWETNTEHIRTLHDLTDKTIEKIEGMIR